jgi:hypothetical protein
MVNYFECFIELFVSFNSLSVTGTRLLYKLVGLFATVSLKSCFPSAQIEQRTVTPTCYTMQWTYREKPRFSIN